MSLRPPRKIFRKWNWTFEIGISQVWCVWEILFQKCPEKRSVELSAWRFQIKENGLQHDMRRFKTEPFPNRTMLCGLARDNIPLLSLVLRAESQCRVWIHFALPLKYPNALRTCVICWRDCLCFQSCDESWHIDFHEQGDVRRLDANDTLNIAHTLGKQFWSDTWLNYYCHSFKFLLTHLIIKYIANCRWTI